MNVRILIVLVAVLALAAALLTGLFEGRGGSDVSGATPGGVQSVGGEGTARKDPGLDRQSVAEPAPGVALVEKPAQVLEVSSGATPLPPGYSYPTDRAFTPDDWLLLVPMGGRVPVSDSVFEEKYDEQLSHEEWLGRATTIGASMLNMAVELGHGLKEEGFYELVKPPTDADGEPLKGWMGGVPDELPLWTVNGGRGVPDGFVKVTWIPWPEYPEVYDLRDEWNFLNSKAALAK